MFDDLSPVLIASGVAVFAAAHLLLVFAPAKVGKLYWLAGAFFLLSPASAASQLSVAEATKYLRVYISLLMVVVGMAGARSQRFGLATRSLGVFVTFYVLAAAWSNTPLAGLLYKTFFALTVLAGALLAYDARNSRELLRGIRFLGVVAAVSGLFVFLYFLANPEASLSHSRLSVLGLNPNRIGQTAAPLLVLCAYLGLYDRSRLWKVIGWSTAVLMGLIIVYTGSRAAFAMAAVGGFLLTIPLGKRPAQIAALVVGVVVSGYVLLMMFDIPALSRFTEQYAYDTRSGSWRGGMRRFAESPLLGHGWITGNGRSTANLLSIYIQTLVETGIVGAAVLLGCLTCIAVQGYRGVRFLRQVRRRDELGILGIALTVAILVHGIGESSALLGSTLNSLLIGLGVGLIDRVPQLTYWEWARQRQRHSAWALSRPMTPPKQRPT
ncbi:MAG: O-antigen ligase family protein [Planctomycetes bacterium]|nr:O-antigen ligase family protein [Planctomycetota bacterium]